MKPRALPSRSAQLAIWAQRPGLGGPLPIKAQRRWLDAAAATLPVPGGTRTEWTTLGGVRTLRVACGDADPSGAVLYLHGGAFTVGSARSHRSLAAFLSRASGYPVFLLEYRLAPEHPYPAALDDAAAAFAALAARYQLPSDQIVIGGDSAGGGLAVATAQRLAGDGGGAPAALALIAPWVDPLRVPDNKRDRVVRERWGRRSAAAYIGQSDPATPGIAPRNGDLAVLPPTLVHVGTEEILLPQIRDFVMAVTAAGGEITLHEFPWMWHVAHAHAGLFGRAAEAVDELGGFVAGQLARSPA